MQASVTADEHVEIVFDSAFLRKLERVELLARKIFRGQLRGEHTTARRGLGLEFSDFRRYRPGDDFRHIDWNIYSRLERLFLKLYAAEEDMSLHVVLDCSASMGFGDPSKFDHARRIAAAMGYIGLSNLDRVSVATIDDGLGPSLAPVKARSQMSTLLRFLQSLATGGPTELALGLRDYAARTRSPGLVVVISDLFAQSQVPECLDVLRYAGHQVVVVHLLAEEEIDPPLDGALRLVDSESGEEVSLTVDHALRQHYAQALAARLQLIETYCLSRDIEYLRASTAIGFEDVVLKYLRYGAALK